jgi:Tfp pilus assembly protein PilO
METFVYILAGAYVLLAGYALFLSVKIDRYRQEIKNLQPPF